MGHAATVPGSLARSWATVRRSGCISCRGLYPFPHSLRRLVAIIPLPLLAIATNIVVRAEHKSFEESQEAFSLLNNHVNESVSGIKVTKSFGYGEKETASFWQTNQDAWKKNNHAAKFNNLFDPIVLIFVRQAK